MTTNTNPSAQPVSDGELKLYAIKAWVPTDGDLNGKQVVMDVVQLKIAEGVLKDLLASARQQSYQSGYAAAVGDAVAASPNKIPLRSLNYDGTDLTQYQTGFNAALDHYRTAIEALGGKK